MKIYSQNYYSNMRRFQQAISELVDKIFLATERNLYTIGIFQDLSEPLDSDNHELLLYKLEH